MRPSGLKVTEFSQSLQPSRGPRSWPVGNFHNLMVWSELPNARVLPSGLKATELTTEVRPSRVRSGVPPAVSHNLIVVSLLADARMLPSGLKATQFTAHLCPRIVSAEGSDRSSSTREIPESSIAARDARLGVPRLPYRRYQATAPQPKKKSPSSIPLGCPAATANTKHIPPTARNSAIYSLTGIKEPPFKTE